jgi:DNA-binding response OmpR family regulator
VFKGYEVGAVDCLFKPCPPEILRAKVKAFVERFRTRQEVARAAEELGGLNKSLHDQALKLEEANAEGAVDCGATFYLSLPREG